MTLVARFRGELVRLESRRQVVAAAVRLIMKLVGLECGG